MTDKQSASSTAPQLLLTQLLFVKQLTYALFASAGLRLNRIVPTERPI